MSDTFDRRPWFYWLILLFAVGETLMVSFRILPFIAALMAGTEPAATQWDLAGPFAKVAVLAGLGGVFAGVIYSILLILRKRSVVKFYWVVILFAVIVLVYNISLINGGLDSQTYSAAVGSVIGSSLQLILTYWGLSILCRNNY